MIRFIKTLCVAALFSGCSDFSVERGYDNPEIRELQKASIQGIAERPIAEQTLDDFFKGKVGLIENRSSHFPSGRAVPITADGYFLTASHVVDAGEFFLSKTVSLRPLPKGGEVMTAAQLKSYFRTVRYKGRLVWSDREADLAIVKFNCRPGELFKELTHLSEMRTVVFSATGSGTTRTLARTKDGIANGPFETAGEITKVTQFDSGEIPYAVYESTLVGRKGMSGAPVADSKGRLIGIITELQRYIEWGFVPSTRTRFAMIDSDACEKMIADDRRGKRWRR